MVSDIFSQAIYLLYYGVPLLAVLMFAIARYRYCIARHKNKRCPGTFSDAEIKRRKIMLIVSSVVFGVLALIVLAFIALLMVAVAFM